MEAATEILELKFDGNGINPSAVKPSEIAQLIDSFEKALISVIQETNPEINVDSVFLSFESIDNKSLDLRFVPQKVKEIVISSYLLIATSISNNDYTKLNGNTITSLKKIMTFSKKHNCTGYFNRNNETISTFNKDTEIIAAKPKIIKGETTVYGKLIDSGGENPNIHLKISDGQTLIFATSDIDAKKLALKLYETVGLAGIAKWDADTLKIVDFKLIDILDYTPNNTLNAINELKKLTSGFWDKFNTNDDINNQLLRD